MTWDGSGSDNSLQYRTHLLGGVKHAAVHHAPDADQTLQQCTAPTAGHKIGGRQLNIDGHIEITCGSVLGCPLQVCRTPWA